MKSLFKQIKIFKNSIKFNLSLPKILIFLLYAVSTKTFFEIYKKFKIIDIKNKYL